LYSAVPKVWQELHWLLTLIDPVDHDGVVWPPWQRTFVQLLPPKLGEPLLRSLKLDEMFTWVLPSAWGALLWQAAQIGLADP
jgi:hypothetical protein